MNFSSDTAAPAHPAILAALTEANDGTAPSYGNDALTARAKAKLCEVFETDLEMWLVASGTAANALGLAVLCPPTGAVLCHEEAHVERDERGAPEFFTGGGKLSLMPGEHGRIDMEALKQRLDHNNPDFVHETPAKAITLSNLTECGAAYSAADTRERVSLAKKHGLTAHLDGARFANALVSTGASPADMSWRAGIDVMSFGATKNGALGCEAIILFGEARKLHADLLARAKRGGHMPPKQRFLAAQMASYLEGGLWMDLARRANASATLLADALMQAGGKLAHPVEGNEVFVFLPAAAVKRLSDAKAGFYPWLDGSHRFVCSWATSEEEIRALVKTVRS